MAFWIFKLAKQEQYPDVPGKQYVYDNRHSIKVKAGDVFLYLDKRQKYSFTAKGVVDKISERPPTEEELKESSKIRIVFTAHLRDVVWFKEPLTLSYATKKGKKYRSQLGIKDLNEMGWSPSVASLEEIWYTKILDLIKSESLYPETGMLPT